MSANLTGLQWHMSALSDIVFLFDVMSFLDVLVVARTSSSADARVPDRVCCGVWPSGMLYVLCVLDLV